MMNSILICLFLFNFGSLAVKIPKDVYKGEVPDLNAESLEKQSFDRSTSRHDPSLTTKRGVGKHSSGLLLQLLLRQIQNKAIFCVRVIICCSASQKGTSRLFLTNRKFIAISQNAESAFSVALQISLQTVRTLQRIFYQISRQRLPAYSSYSTVFLLLKGISDMARVI